MKAPITTSQAWAVIAESAGWNAQELPVLPKPDVYAYDINTAMHVLTAHSTDKLQAYGQQCAAHARGVAQDVTELVEALEMLIYLIDRNAPELSGKVVGYARAALSKYKGAK